MGNVDLPQKNEVKYPGMHLDKRLTWAKAHQNQKKTAQPTSETNALATRKINAINRKQTLPIESSNSNTYGLMEFSYGGQPPIPTPKSSSAFNPRRSDPF
jgi:hypothetical protein